MAQKTKPTSLQEVFGHPKYQGKIVVAAGGEVHATGSEQQALRWYRKLKKKYPEDKPVTTVVPESTMIMLPQFLVR